MLNIENKEDETMTDLVYVVFDPAGPYIQGVYTTTESAAIGARMAMEAAVSYTHLTLPTKA